MFKAVRLVLAVMLLAGATFVAPAATAQTSNATPGDCQEGVLPSGGLSMYCVPSSGWNGDLAIWAHGYTAFNAPLDFQNLTLPDGTYIPDLAQQLGFAFATTSYRQNGLAILEGVEDIRELVQGFADATGQLQQRTYLIGASEGGIVTALSIERYPALYSGGLAMCGPIGDFQKQMNYWGDFRTLFDYFFPGVIPGSPIAIPDEVIANWDAVYVPAVQSALAANPSAARQLMRTSRAAHDLRDPSTIETTTLHLLWYNVFATNDGVQKLGGNPYDNQDRVYHGSLNDQLLNQNVQRFSADPAATQQLTLYETSGQITKPLVTQHTTGDEIIPFWHEPLYVTKVQPSGSGSLAALPVFRYGHCNFTTAEALGAFGLLIMRVRGTPQEGLPPTSAAQAAHDFARAVRETQQ